MDPLAERVLPKPTLDSESVLSLHVPPKHLAVLDIGLEGTCLLRYFVEDLAKWVRVIWMMGAFNEKRAHGLSSLIYAIQSAILHLLFLKEPAHVRHY